MFKIVDCDHPFATYFGTFPTVSAALEAASKTAMDNYEIQTAGGQFPGTCVAYKMPSRPLVQTEGV